MFYPRSSGSGTSGTGVNFILNPDAESDTSGWATYQDAAGATPVDGTGGSPTVTWTRSTSSPLTGTASFVLTKDAANRQGDGASYAFTIDSASQARVLAINFDFIVGSGTFVAGSSGVDSDIECYILDVTNNVLIQPSSYKLFSNSSTISGHFSANFQSASNSTSYRLIFHCATTSASAYTVKFDTVQVGPSSYVYGTPITDWTAYTPTFTGFGTATSVNFISRRVGSSLEVVGTFTAGTNTGVEAQITLGYGGANANVITVSTLPTLGLAGKFVGGTASATWFGGGAVTMEASKTYMTLATQTSSTSGLSKILANALNSSGAYSINASFPITGWSSSVQMSDSADQRVVAFYATHSQTVNNTTPTLTLTSVYDDVGGLSTNTYTVKVPGKYIIKGSIRTASAAWTVTNAVELSYSKNGAATVPIGRVNPATGTYVVQVNGNDTLNLVAGDTIVFKGYSDVSNTATGYVAIERMTGPSAIGATETIAARYTNTAGTSIANSGDVKVPFATKDDDSHGNFVTDTYTIQTAGRYRISGNINFASSLYAAANTVVASIYKNNSIAAVGPTTSIGGAITDQVGVAVTATLKLVAGDTIDVRVSNNRTAGATLLFTQTGSNSFEIQRVGV